MYYGEKVKLRAYKREDVTRACEFVNDSEVKSHLVSDIPYPTMFEQELKWIEEQINLKDGYNFAIEALENNKYIGGCGVFRIDWLNRTANVGIMIGDKDYWSKGYGTDAMKVLIKFIFEQMNLNKIKLNVFGFNKRAMKCYEKCGFKVEGTLRQELFRDGQYHDVYAMALLKKEWQSL